MNDTPHIIIVTYNGMQWLSKCLESTTPYPVVIVDNNSTDDTVEYIKRNHPEMKLIVQTKNLGFGQANNIGISYALREGAEYIFLLNQDAYLKPGCIERLINSQRKSPEYGILSPLHLNGQGDRLDNYFSNYLNFRANPDFYSDFVLNKPRKEIYEVPFVNAAGWLVSRKCLETVGGFDPMFFHYGEDDNYCQRVHYHGLKVGVCPETSLKHDRETREIKKMESGTSEYFENKAKSLKIRFTNINKPYLNELLILGRKRKRAWKKSLFKLKFKQAAYLKLEIEMLGQVHKEVLESRKQTKKEGLTYLSC